MQLQATNAALPAKQNAAAFVHGVAEMEVQAFTLRETAKKLREESEAAEKSAAQRIATAFEKRKKQAEAYEEANRTYQHPPSYFRFRSDEGSFWEDLLDWEGAGLFIAFFLFGYLYVLPVVFTLGLFGVIPFEAEVKPVLLGITIVIILIHVLITRGRIRRYNIFKKKTLLEKCNEELDQLSKADEALRQAQLEYQTAETNAHHAQQRAAELENSAAYIESRLGQCYDLNIIPPSYRKLVYVVLLDDIYMNDKADNMREAILICDTEIRHSQLISKLDDIHRSLETLAKNIQFVGALLYDMQQNMTQISQSIYQMHDTQEQIAYAADAVQRTAANADMYMYQRRVGII